MKVSCENRVSSLIYISIGLYVLVMCLPVLQAQSILLNAIVFVCFACFILGVLSTRAVSIHFVIFVTLITVFDFLIFETQWSDYTSLPNKMLLLYEFWFPAIVSLELISNREIYSHDRLETILTFFLIAYLITCVTTAIGNLKYDIPSRWLATGTIDKALAYKYKLENIGGFGFCYLSLFVAPLLIYLYKQTKKSILMIPLVLSYVCAICSQYFILILILAIITVLALFREMTARKKAVFLFCTGVLFIIAGLNFDGLLNWLISVTQNQEVLQKRIQDVYYVIKGGSTFTYTDLQLRQNVYLESWKAFLENPLTGGWFHSRIGGHSEILDLMGSMGLLGVMLLFSILWTIKWGMAPCYFKLDNSNKKVIKLMLIILLLLATLNPIFSSREIGIAFFVVLLFVDTLEPNRDPNLMDLDPA